jgi:SAM-dependent methyltransferase
MASSARWQQAQEYERRFWENQARAIATGASSKLDWYRWSADQLVARLKALGVQNIDSGTARVLEVGCGPIGIVSAFPAAERVGVDPLEPVYAANPSLSALRDPAVKYLQGVGEKLPCESSHFDLVIIENCIDHVQDMEGVRRELARVTRPGGHVFLTVNCRTLLGYFVHRFLSRTRIDSGHPHTFTANRARGFLEGRGFHVVGFEAGSAWDAHVKDITSGQRRAQLKALIGVSELVAQVVARREPDGS